MYSKDVMDDGGEYIHSDPTEIQEMRNLIKFVNWFDPDNEYSFVAQEF